MEAGSNCLVNFFVPQIALIFANTYSMLFYSQIIFSLIFCLTAGENKCYVFTKILLLI